MNENTIYLKADIYIEINRRASRFNVICDIMESDMPSYQKEDAIRIVCGIDKKEEK